MEKDIRRHLEGENHPGLIYANHVIEHELIHAMELGLRETLGLLKRLSTEEWVFRYAPGKWSVKEIAIHMMDTERIFAYRALRIARGDRTPLPGFEQDDYIPFLDTDHRSPTSILREYESVRNASIAMFEHFNEEMLLRKGIASGNEASSLAYGYMIPGHEFHHLQILREKYFPQPG